MLISISRKSNVTLMPLYFLLAIVCNTVLLGLIIQISFITEEDKQSCQPKRASFPSSLMTIKSSSFLRATIFRFSSPRRGGCQVHRFIQCFIEHELSFLRANVPRRMGRINGFQPRSCGINEEVTENFRHVFFHPTSIQSSPQLDYVSITLLFPAEFLILMAVQWCRKAGCDSNELTSNESRDIYNSHVYN